MKRNWTIVVPGYPPFPMILLDGELDHAAATREALGIWPACEVQP